MMPNAPEEQASPDQRKPIRLSELRGVEAEAFLRNDKDVSVRGLTRRLAVRGSHRV